MLPFSFHVGANNKNLFVWDEEGEIDGDKL